MAGANEAGLRVLPGKKCKAMLDKIRLKSSAASRQLLLHPQPGRPELSERGQEVVGELEDAETHCCSLVGVAKALEAAPGTMEGCAAFLEAAVIAARDGGLSLHGYFNEAHLQRQVDFLFDEHNPDTAAKCLVVENPAPSLAADVMQTCHFGVWKLPELQRAPLQDKTFGSTLARLSPGSQEGPLCNLFLFLKVFQPVETTLCTTETQDIVENLHRLASAFAPGKELKVSELSD